MARRGLCGESFVNPAEKLIDLGDGQFYFEGTRPSPTSHKHGCCSKKLVILVSGRPRYTTIHKQRWYDYETHRTCHSRPSEDTERIRFCTSIIVLRLAAVLLCDSGFHNRSELFEAMDECGSDRTVQRWLAKAQIQGKEIEQAIRLVVISKVEPQPLEKTFPGGLSPPANLVCKNWKHPTHIAALWSGYTMLLVAAREHGEPLSVLVAEARRRCQTAKIPFSL